MTIGGRTAGAVLGLAWAWCGVADVLQVPGEYATIQAAIDAAVDGDEIVVAPGLYPEQLSVQGKGITLRSCDPLDPAVVASTILAAAFPGAAAAYSDTPSSGMFSLDGFTLNETNGVSFSGTNLTIERCVFESPIEVSWLVNVSGADVIVRECSSTGSFYVDRAAIEVGTGYSLLVEDCDFGGSMYGPFIEADDADVTIRNSTFSGIAIAFDLYSASHGSPKPTHLIEDCDFSGMPGPQSSIGNIGESCATVRRCTFRDFGTPAFSEGGYGLSIVRSEAEFTECTFERISSETWHAAVVVSGAEVSFTDCDFVDNWAEEEGAALHVNESTVLIDACDFRENYLASPNSGGACITCFGDFDGATIEIRGSTFEDNQSFGTGGAITMAPDTTLQVTDSAFRRNLATRSSGAAGINSAVASFTRCTFEENRAGSFAGTLGSYAKAEVTVVDCVFLENVGRYGGALYAHQGGVVSAVNCAFEGNTAIRKAGTDVLFGRGGAAYALSLGSIEIASSTLVGNSAMESGGGVAVDDEGTASLIACTVASNDAPIGSACSAGADSSNGQEGAISFANCVFTGHLSTTRFFDGSGTAIGAGWSIAPELLPGSSNITGDPMIAARPDHGGDGWFDDPFTPDLDESANNDYGDLRLLPGSPAIDAGDSSLLPADTFDLDADGDTAEPLPLDLDGNPRVTDDPATPDTGPVSPAVDLGAYEFQPAACPADLTGDGVVNFDDIDAFVAGFLGGDLIADCDGTGVLNFDDIDCFVASFLAGCP